MRPFKTEFTRTRAAEFLFVLRYCFFFFFFNSTFALRTIMIACNIKQMSKEVSPIFSAGDIAKIRTFSRSKVSFHAYAHAPVLGESVSHLGQSPLALRTCLSRWRARWLPAFTATSTSRRPYFACCWVAWRKCWRTDRASEETSTSFSSVQPDAGFGVFL